MVLQFSSTLIFLLSMLFVGNLQACSDPRTNELSRDIVITGKILNEINHPQDLSDVIDVLLGEKNELAQVVRRPEFGCAYPPEVEEASINRKMQDFFDSACDALTQFPDALSSGQDGMLTGMVSLSAMEAMAAAQNKALHDSVIKYCQIDEINKEIDHLTKVQEMQNAGFDY